VSPRQPHNPLEEGEVNLKNEVNIEIILRERGEFRAECNARLERLELR
jgi:hypothetical protein